jgi:hypothetical protein
MPNSERIVFTPVLLSGLHAEKLPDGSIALYDERTKSVHSLNPSAAVAWDTCANGATVIQVGEALTRHFGTPISLDVAWAALERLQQAELILSDAPVSAPVVDLARRSALKTIGTMGGVALPLVLTLTASEQHALAQGAASATTTRAPTTTRLLQV